MGIALEGQDVLTGSASYGDTTLSSVAAQQQQRSLGQGVVMPSEQRYDVGGPKMIEGQFVSCRLLIRSLRVSTSIFMGCNYAP